MDYEDLSGNTIAHENESENGSIDSQIDFEVSLGFSDMEKEDDEIMMDSLVGAFEATDITPYTCERCKSKLHTASDCIASHDINNELIVSDCEYDNYTM